VDGDGEAFVALVEPHLAGARRLIRAAIGDSADVDDALQEGLLAAWRGLERYDPTRSFGPWLLQVVLNAARDLARRERVRRTEEIPATLATPAAGPDVLADRALLRARLRQALATLPERQRVAVTLFDAEGYSHAEIARILGVPEGTVRSDVFHARRALRRLLGEGDDA